MKHVISTNMAVVIASAIGQIWEIKHTDKDTTVVVSNGNEDYRVTWIKGTDKVTVEPWIW